MEEERDSGEPEVKGVRKQRLCGASRGEDAVMGDSTVVIRDPEPDKDSVGGHQQV